MKKNDNAQVHILEVVAVIGILMTALFFSSSFEVPVVSSPYTTSQLEDLANGALASLDSLDPEHEEYSSLLTEYVSKVMDANSNLRGYWSMDDYISGLLVTDDSIYNNNGELKNELSVSEFDGHDKCLIFDGVDDYLLIEDSSGSLNITDDFTLEAYIYVSDEAFFKTKVFDINDPPETWPDEKYLHDYEMDIISKEDQYRLYIFCDVDVETEDTTKTIHYDYRINFSINSEDNVYMWTSGNTLIEGLSKKWHHIAAVYDSEVESGPNLKIYIDDEEERDNDHNAPSDIIVSANPVTIGCKNDTGTDEAYETCFESAIDDVKIWSRALDPEDFSGELVDEDFKTHITESFYPNIVMYNLMSYDYYDNKETETMLYPQIRLETNQTIVRANRLIVHNKNIYDVVLEVWVI